MDLMGVEPIPQQIVKHPAGFHLFAWQILWMADRTQIVPAQKMCARSAHTLTTEIIHLYSFCSLPPIPTTTYKNKYFSHTIYIKIYLLYTPGLMVHF